MWYGDGVGNTTEENITLVPSL